MESDGFAISPGFWRGTREEFGIDQHQLATMAGVAQSDVAGLETPARWAQQLGRTRSEIAFDLIALYKALGGGWEIGDIKPIVPEAMQAQMMNRTDWGNLLPAPKARAPASASPNPISIRAFFCSATSAP